MERMQSDTWNWGARNRPDESFYDELSTEESLAYRMKQKKEEAQLRAELSFDVDDIYPIDYMTFRL